MQTDRTPTAKVGQIPIAGAAVLIIIFFSAKLGFEIPAEVAVAIVTLVTFGIGYYIRDRRTPDLTRDATAAELNTPQPAAMPQYSGGVGSYATDLVDYQSGYAAAVGGYISGEFDISKRSESWRQGYANGVKFRLNENYGKTPEGSA